MILTDLHTFSSQATDYLIALAQTWLRIPRRSYAASELMEDRIRAVEEYGSIDSYWAERAIRIHYQQECDNAIMRFRYGIPHVSKPKILAGSTVTSMQRKVVRS